MQTQPYATAEAHVHRVATNFSSGVFRAVSDYGYDLRGSMLDLISYQMKALLGLLPYGVYKKIYRIRGLIGRVSEDCYLASFPRRPPSPPMYLRGGYHLTT